MSKVLSAAEIKIEAEAQKRRDDAKKYLDGVGQSIEKVDLKKSGISNDNTIELLLAEKRKNMSYTPPTTNTTTATKILSTKTIPGASTNNASTDKLLPDWQAVLDGSGNTYYWNTKTNETKWEKPLDNSASSTSATSDNKLPSYWIEKVHSATFQTYYIHEKTGNKRWEMPAYDDDGTSVTAPSQQQQTTEVVHNNKKQRSDPIGPTMKK